MGTHCLDPCIVMNIAVCEVNNTICPIRVAGNILWRQIAMVDPESVEIRNDFKNCYPSSIPVIRRERLSD